MRLYRWLVALVCVSIGLEMASSANKNSGIRSAFCAIQNNNRVHSTLCVATAPKNAVIIGGGLAGLSTAFHFVTKSPDTRITILDKAPVGTAGASSVAGGLVHPLSPRGKLLPWGLEGLEATNRLVTHALVHKPQTLLRDHLYRIALTEQHATFLQKTSKELPNICTWQTPEEIQSVMGSTNNNILGGVRLSNRCMVLHVPSYLEGLCCAIQELSKDTTAQWITGEYTVDSLQDYDVVILAAGAGLFQDFVGAEDLPIDLVRGQSIEMNVAGQVPPLLCGKYISPTLQPGRALIGATHEFKDTPLSRERVVEDLRERTSTFAPDIWKHGTVSKITSGVRVQSRRGALGRMPIVGRFSTELHDNTWIFTGLSSRGLLYHGLYGDLLTNAILNENDAQWEEYKLDWWRNESLS